MIDETSFASDVADELGLTSSAYAEDVTGEVDLDNTAYGEDVAEAINEMPVGDPDLTVCQLNIGHFAMGTSPNNGATPAWTDDTADGWNATPKTISRNYSIQLERWQKFIDALGVDIFGMPEYSAIFGTHNNYNVPTQSCGIFDDYIPSEYTTAEQIAKRISVGKTAGGGYWINTLISKYDLSNAQDIDLGSTVSNMAYVRVAEITLKGKTVKVAVTHLNWNQSQAYYNSRQAEITSLVSLFSNDDYVILCGDFNCRPMNGDEVNGLHDLDPFVSAGFTLANNLNHPLATCYATGSKPDVNDPNYPFVYIDNIIVKGFTISNVRVLDTGVQVDGGTVDVGMLTDHCAVVADLTLIDNE